MTTGVADTLALLLAVTGAALIGAGTALQQRAGHDLPLADRTRLLRLARRGRWWLGQGVVAVGFLAYASALLLGPLVLVQPVVVLSLPVGTMVSARLAGRYVDRRLFASAAAASGGLALFLVAARPSSGTATSSPDSTAVLAAAGLAAVVGLVVALSAAPAPRTRLLWCAGGYALAAGIFYGDTAVLLSSLLHPPAPIPLTATTGALGAGVVVAAAAGWLCAQQALQRGRLLTPVTALISTADPVVAVALGVAALGEQVATTPVALAAQGLGALAVVAGIAATSRRSVALLAGDSETTPASTWG